MGSLNGTILPAARGGCNFQKAARFESRLSAIATVEKETRRDCFRCVEVQIRTSRVYVGSQAVTGDIPLPQTYFQYISTAMEPHTQEAVLILVLNLVLNSNVLSIVHHFRVYVQPRLSHSVAARRSERGEHRSSEYRFSGSSAFFNGKSSAFARRGSSTFSRRGPSTCLHRGSPAFALRKSTTSAYESHESSAFPEHPELKNFGKILQTDK
ncbi:hypothetical protein BDV98DRAFT_593606 [Pterulicium gracile]|uniref:Uncharacterized protein n=1 Tax=Pterulicium gracile TaxID=1884261 RepID=A0A5C3QFG6_9AGAR|nr:hypothetical protein BDV98DRAFT_593606 [Pterula gracilis]